MGDLGKKPGPHTRPRPPEFQPSTCAVGLARTTFSFGNSSFWVSGRLFPEAQPHPGRGSPPLPGRPQALAAPEAETSRHIRLGVQL